MLETDNETYRVEEYYPSVNSNCEDFRNKDFLEKAIKMICDFNYDPKFLNEIRKSELTCEKMISDHQNGWYWIAKNQTLPVIEEMR